MYIIFSYGFFVPKKKETFVFLEWIIISTLMIKNKQIVEIGEK